jgi:hypothetical protein
MQTVAVPRANDLWPQWYSFVSTWISFEVGLWNGRCVDLDLKATSTWEDTTRKLSKFDRGITTASSHTLPALSLSLGPPSCWLYPILRSLYNSVD